MRFKGIICLTKVTKNQTHTERNESTIIFNESKIEIIDTLLNMNIANREVFYIASSNSDKKKDENGKVYYDVKVNWVTCFKQGEHELLLSEDVTDILFMTNEIYENMRLSGLSDDEIYLKFKKNGLGFMVNELPSIEDFSVLTACIV